MDPSEWYASLRWGQTLLWEQTGMPKGDEEGCPPTTQRLAGERESPMGFLAQWPHVSARNIYGYKISLSYHFSSSYLSFVHYISLGSHNQ